MRFCSIFVCVFVMACGESHRGDEDLAAERLVSDTGLAEFDADDPDFGAVVEAGLVIDDAQVSDPDVTVDSSVDVEVILTPDASPEVDAEPVDATLHPDVVAPVEDAGPDSPDSDTDALPLDASVEEGPPLNQELCPNAGVRLESITPSEDFPGLLLLSLDYDNGQGMICFEDQCFEGVLDPPDERYPTALITPQYIVSWNYMPSGQLTSLSVSDPNGLVVEISGLFGPPGTPNSPGRYDDHGRHYTGVMEVSFLAQNTTVGKLPGGPDLIFLHPCRPDRVQ